jgi:hypothetical protein
LEVAAAVVQINVGGVHLILIRQDIDAVAFLIGDQGVEGDVVILLFLSEHVASGVGRACFQGKTIRRADRDKIGLQGGVGVLFLFSAAAFTGKSQPDHCDQQGTDERLAHQFPRSYGSRSKHFRYKYSK